MSVTAKVLLAVGGLLLVGLLLVLGYVLGRRRPARAAAAAGAPEPTPAAAAGEEAPETGRGLRRGMASRVELRRAFKRTVRLLRTNVSGRNYRYQIPWFMMVSQAGGGKRTVLAHTDLTLPFGRPPEDVLGTDPGCTFWCYEGGVVLDVAGDFLLRTDGRTSDDGGWKAVLRLLLKHRPERPIDGVIVTLACTDLVGPGASLDDRLAKLRETGTRVYQKLWRAQRTLGVCFPIYLLVTKCDALKGFRSFARAIPPRFHQEIFGWSSPYAVETTYFPEMVEQAFDSLARDLHERKLEVFAEGRPVPDADELFAFPGEFTALRQPLRTYLNQLFQASVYHESFFLRGIYFTGDAGAETAERGAPAAEEGVDTALAVPPAAGFAMHQPAFLRHLFERKVFLEYGLARPFSRVLLSRNRVTQAAQALLLFSLLGGGLGLWIGYAHLSEGKRVALPVLEDIRADLDEVEARSTRAGAGSATHFEDEAGHLLKGMTRITGDLLASVFIPSSWWSPLHEKMRQVMTLAWDKVILRTMAQELRGRAQRFLDEKRGVDPGARREAGVASLEASPEFLALRHYLNGIKEVEEYIFLYNDLKLAKDLSGLGRLAKFLFNTDLPPEFLTKAVVYHTRGYNVSLGETEWQTLDPARRRAEASAILKRLAGDFFARAFEANALGPQVRDLAQRIERLEAGGRAGLSDVAVFREVLDGIVQSEELLARPELAWIGKSRFDAGPEYQRMLAAIASSKALGPAVRAEVERSGEEGFQRLKAELAAASTKLAGPVLEDKDGALALKLSDRVQAVKTAADTLLSLKLTTVADRASLRTRLARGTRLVWDAKLLEDAVRLSEQYYQLVRGELASLPSPLSGVVRTRAVRGLELNMLDLVVRAARVQPLAGGPAASPSEPDLRLEAPSLAQASDLLLQILDTFQQLGFNEGSRDLFELLRAQALRLLEATDQLLGDDGLYTVREGNFAWWDGTPPASLRAFEVGDAKELQRYLDLQRERAAILARQYAAPALAFLTTRPSRRTPSQDRLVTKWQRILAELELYDQKKPNTAIAVLEKFILTDMDEITPKTLFQKVTAKDLAEPSADYFLGRRNSLRRDLYGRAQVLASATALADYAQIERLFNQRLAGKFPFAAGRVEEGAAEAEPEAVREFFQLYDKAGKAAMEVVRRSARPGPARDDAVRFLDQMGDVRAFLGALLDGGGKGQPPAADFDVDFRVNEAKEVGGNQVIEWSLEVGQQKVRQRDAKRSGRWRFGDPARFALRWAKDAREVPVADRQHSDARVDERSVAFAYKNRWSLLSLLLRHAVAPGDVDGPTDPSPHTLKFLIATRPAPDARQLAAPPAGAEAKVFIRVALRPVDKKDALLLPAFPSRAPQLNAASGG